jgi:glycosyltransferase involved in cell wall biosynthesis
MRVLFIGSNGGQPKGMKLSIERRGHEVTVVDPYPVITHNYHLHRWSFHTGALFIDRCVHDEVRRLVEPLGPFDVAFVDNGDIINARTVRYLRAKAVRVVLFNRDNPFLQRDGMRWRALWKALPFYDLYVTPRETTAKAAAERGARRVLQVNFFADELLHQPREPAPEQRARFGSPVSFVGTWFPERGAFMQTLLDRGVPLRIIGHKWDRAKNWEQLRPHTVMGYLSPYDYCDAVLSSQIAIAMLSKGNHDVATSRSMEIPAMGKVLCGERTAEHQRLYHEGEEAVFWSSAEECADQCLELLRDPARIAAISAAGRRAAERNGNWSEPMMQRILDAALEP